MEYKYKEIGERISEERRKLIVKDKNGKERKCSQSEFINKIKDRGGSIGRNRLSAIENGERAEITLDELILMSDMFKCDIGYLLGEYTERRKRVTMRKKHECRYCLCGAIPPQGENFPNEDSKLLTKFQMSFGDLKERIGVSVFNARLYLDTKESVVTSREINYCPMCGRYLRGNNNEAAI